MATEDLHDPKALSESEFLWVMSQIPVLRAWATSVEREAMNRLLKGEKLPGYKLVEGRTNRRWTDLKKAFKAMRRMGLSEDEFAPRNLVSPSKAEKLLKKAKLSESFSLISSLMERPRGKPSIAPEEDPRPEYVRGEEFTDESLEDDRQLEEDEYG